MISDLQLQIASWLRADPDFDSAPTVPVVTERQGDWLNRIDLEIKSGLGLALVVAVPALSADKDGGLSVRADVAIHVWENVVRNMAPSGRNLPAPDAALAALGALANREPTGGWSPLAFRALRMGDAGAGLLMYELVLSTGILLKTTRAQ